MQQVNELFAQVDERRKVIWVYCCVHCLQSCICYSLLF